MKVWVVTHWTLSGIEEETKVIGVFSEEFLAKDYIKRVQGHPANNAWYCTPFEMNELSTAKDGYV